nr:MAG TPA: hypothetical protein [Caudoviricetes sp.]
MSCLCNSIALSQELRRYNGLCQISSFFGLNESKFQFFAPLRLWIYKCIRFLRLLLGFRANMNSLLAYIRFLSLLLSSFAHIDLLLFHAKFLSNLLGFQTLLPNRYKILLRHQL